MLSGRATVFRPLRERDFRLVWTGDAVSVLGDQFYIVALPWLILGLTGSGLAVGTTLMLTAVPRATLMLVGGAVSDRYSPRRILVAASAVRAVLVGLIGWLAWAGVVPDATPVRDGVLVRRRES